VALAEAESQYRRGHDLDQAIRFLRASGFSIIDCIKAVMTLTNCGLAEAKRIVHSSEAWSDKRADHDAFHEALESGLRDLDAIGEDDNGPESGMPTK
jgi:ribosomal protein L7/L12